MRAVKQLRVDFEKPLNDTVEVFARGRYLDLTDDKIHIDGGVRWENDKAKYLEGAAATNQPVQPGVVGVPARSAPTFDGAYTVTRRTQDKVAWTIGASHLQPQPAPGLCHRRGLYG